MQGREGEELLGLPVVLGHVRTVQFGNVCLPGGLGAR